MDKPISYHMVALLPILQFVTYQNIYTLHYVKQFNITILLSSGLREKAFKSFQLKSSLQSSSCILLTQQKIFPFTISCLKHAVRYVQYLKERGFLCKSYILSVQSILVITNTTFAVISQMNLWEMQFSRMGQNQDCLRSKIKLAFQTDRISSNDFHLIVLFLFSLTS